MEHLKMIKEIKPLHGHASEGVQRKGSNHLTQLYARWISEAKFCVMATVGLEGTDALPRGDYGPVVRIHDSRTLMMHDWCSDNRIENLRNIVEDG